MSKELVRLAKERLAEINKAIYELEAEREKIGALIKVYELGPKEQKEKKERKKRGPKPKIGSPKSPSPTALSSIPIIPMKILRETDERDY